MSGFKILHHDNPTEVANGQTIEIVVQGPGDTNRLRMFSGVAILAISGHLDPGGPDVVAVQIVIPIPQGYRPPQQGFRPTTLVSIASDFTKDDDCIFEIQNVTTTFDTDSTGINTINILLAASVDLEDFFNRLAYQVCAPLSVSGGGLSGALTTCDLTGYSDFSLAVVDSDLAAVPNPSRIVFVLDVSSNKATMLVIFTGIAIVNIRTTDDGIVRRGQVSIFLDFDLIGSDLKQGSATASLCSIFNNWQSGEDVTNAVDCVSIGSTILETIQGSVVIGKLVPAITAALALQGGVDKVGLNRITYEANVQVVKPLQLLVSAGPPDPQSFGSSATITAGSSWLYQVNLPFPFPIKDAKVDLKSNLAVTPVQSPAPFVSGDSSFTSGPQSSLRVAHGELHAVITATFASSFGILTATATLKVLPPAL